MKPDEDRQDDRECGRCGGVLVRIVYGLPGYEMFEAAERGEVVLGGCVVFDGLPTLRCRDCGEETGRLPLPGRPVDGA